MSLRDPGLGPLGNEGGDLVIRMTVKDYIDSVMLEVRKGFDRLDAKLDNKADKSVVDELTHRVADLERARPEPQYSQRLLDEFRDVQKDVSDLKTNAVTETRLEESGKEVKRLLYGVLATVVAGVTVGVVLAFLHPHF